MLNLKDVQTTRKLVDEADALLIGVGAGVSASGGLNYADPALFDRWYSDYKSQGFKTILDIMGRYWWLHMNKPEEYWAFWARHILHIRYEPEALEPYRLLRELVADKEHFIISTNVDGQLEKAGFSAERIFAPQGDYGLFQCIKPCSQELYDNREQVARMVKNMFIPQHAKEQSSAKQGASADNPAQSAPLIDDSAVFSKASSRPSPGAQLARIRSEDVPFCPKCGSLLVPNLRCDNSFVEERHLVKQADYLKFIEKNAQKRLVLLELGVGYNTPIIIRYPFENITLKFPQASLVRFNLEEADMPNKIKEKGIVLAADIAESLKAVLAE